MFDIDDFVLDDYLDLPDDGLEKLEEHFEISENWEEIPLMEAA